MPFYQDPFFQEFRGNLVLGDRQHTPEWICPAHAQRSHSEVTSIPIVNTYNLTVNDGDGNPVNILNIVFAIDRQFMNYATIAVDCSGAVPAATTPTEIIAALNANAQFSGYFTASAFYNTIKIAAKFTPDRIKFYIANGQLETILRFNAKAGVAELPSYFSRHTVASRWNFPDGTATLIELDTVGSVVDAAVVDNAVDAYGVSKGFDSTNVQEDWELLQGKSGLFMFQKITLDAVGNIAQIIEYHAGAGVGDLAKQICYFRNGGAIGANPYRITEVPYVLTAADLVVPDCSEATDPGP